jgi:hypothetical protein
LYPGKSQILSFSYFRKNFENPIELKQTTNKNIKYVNSDNAVNSGIEIEFRTLLSSIFKNESASFLDNTTLFSNIAVIKSKVDISSFNETEKYRPMQGQSPYVFNAGIQYINKENGLIFSTNINRVGNRIAFSGNDDEPSIWEKARTFVDMQIAKTFKENKFEIKLNIQNLLAQNQIFYQNVDSKYVYTEPLSGLTNLIFTGDTNNENGYKESQDNLIWKIKNGSTISFSMTYNF